MGLISWAISGINLKFDYSNMNFTSEYPLEGEYFGLLTIPTLNKEIPIFEGTKSKELEKGMGHVLNSAMPGEKNNCVISGHRDTVLRGIGKLKIGDKLFIETFSGKFTYEVKSFKIVHKDDKTVIVPTEYALLTITTCYPFNYIGSAPDRYIISAVLLNSELTKN